MSIDYIRKMYGCNHKIGDQVKIRQGAGTWFDGMTGKLIATRAAYFVVKGKTWRGNFHPDDVVEVEKPAAASIGPTP